MKEVQASEDGPWTATFDAEMKRVRTKWAEGRGEEEKVKGYWYLVRPSPLLPYRQGPGWGSKEEAEGWKMVSSARELGAKADPRPCFVPVHPTEDARRLPQAPRSQDRIKTARLGD